jgi:hypothetical protein
MVDRDKLEMIAKGLLEYETLDGSQIKEIVDQGANESRQAVRLPRGRESTRAFRLYPADGEG